ncbi:3',5'-cyclic adenosine monophosphate phosphodiesterase CpdA [Candidatus Methanoperedenaceae archaeon GB50]|nr:MAG: 3',5'-cyclic adenosine monophosphate phosphodiesterase CpdA [Candidatus Methanoperedenaceae archaeon GB50]CAD7775351.1 3',5'-cyclic adenosine monophosphate phosphodiesterase CpdA [Candidatus Methanoperedenaceae archaeon GB37]CAD7775443.1 3',5'-cyclic adenosine monophosphate phosphodiesterase CpdA [Candidatus Methanoperedenaceae archaeon GB50]
MRLHKIILLLGILGVVVLQLQTGIASGSISVEDADAVRNFTLNTAPSDAINSTDVPQQETFIDVFVNDADAARDFNLIGASDDALNSTDASEQETFIDVFVNDVDAMRDFDFSNSPPAGYSVGQGAPDLATKNHFTDAYNRNGGADVLGSPTTEVHRAWGYLVQDFPGATGYAGGIIMYNPYKNYAYYIHGAIWERYYDLGGPRATTDIEFELGPPVSDIEPYIHTHPPEVSSHGTQFRYQNFEGGALEHNVDTGEVFEVHGAIFAKWRELGYADDELGLVTSDEREAAQSPIRTEGRVSDFEGGHIHWHRTGGHAGKSYETHGAIDAVYCAEGGSGGDLGFPVSDEYVNPSGYPQSDFEGGYITTTDGVNYYVYMNDDAEGPALEITSPEDGFHTDEYRIDISGTASDDSGILYGKVVIASSGFDNSDDRRTAKWDPETDKWETNIPLAHGDNVIRVFAVDNKHNPTEKTITVYCNPPDFSFAHITDAHIDDDCETKWSWNNLKYEKYCESQEKFSSTLYEVNSKKPAFILDTGDCVEYDDEELFKRYMETLDRYIDKDIKIYHTPGNHDRRNKFFETTDLSKYNAIVKPNNGPHTSLNDGYGDYYFDEGGYRFIGLDSGHDWSVVDFLTPEGSGLEDDQYMRLLESDIKDHPKKIIFMHHPVINEGDDGFGGIENRCPEKGGNDMCIGAFRCGLINYCIDHGVQLVLTGHTHKSYNVQISNTRFIQTPSATKDTKWACPLVPDVVICKHGYRIIYIKSGKAYPQLYTTGAHSNVKGELECPAHLHAYDSQGRHTGLNASGGVETGIPDSFYIGRYNYSDPNETETILLYNTTEEYRFEIVANLTEEITGNESFNFTVEQQTDDTRTTIAHLRVPLTENTTATLPINLTTTAYTMEIDHDGDGATDETEDPDFTVTNYAPTASINTPETGSIYNVSEPVEFNGTGRDPEDGILTNFSLVWYSDINGVIGAGERFSTENLSAGAHRITLMVNDSTGLTATQHIALTITEPTTSSAPAWYLHNDSTMCRTTTNPTGNLTIEGGSSNLWIADEPAQRDLTFPPGVWTGRITLETPLASGESFSVAVGNCSGDIFTGSGSAVINGDGSRAFDFQITADSFEIVKDDYLAVNITDTTTGIEVKTGGTQSYLVLLDNAPPYPVPELPGAFLIMVGLLILVGFVGRRW